MPSQYVNRRDCMNVSNADNDLIVPCTRTGSRKKRNHSFPMSSQIGSLIICTMIPRPFLHVRSSARAGPLPSDIIAFMSYKKLQEAFGQGVQLSQSTTSARVVGSISGGTAQTVVVLQSIVPKEKMRLSLQPFSLSPGTSELSREDVSS